VSIHSANRSRLAALFSGDSSFDVYTRAVSDVYQDLFGEGSFTGKGIYEVEIFQQVVERRFPSNAILSHDMIEGAYARAGLLSDVEVIDDYPSRLLPLIASANTVGCAATANSFLAIPARAGLFRKCGTQSDQPDFALENSG